MASRPLAPAVLEPVPQPYRKLLAGAIGGTVAAMVTCPLDVLRTRLQSSAAPALRSMSPLALGMHIVRTEGVSALWKGLTPTVMGVGPARAINFAIYGHSKGSLQARGITGSKQHVLAAASAGLCTVTATSPIWVVKTRMQLETARVAAGASAAAVEAGKALRYRGFFSTGVYLWRKEGIRGLFRVSVYSALLPIRCPRCAAAGSHCGEHFVEQGVSASYLGIAETMLQFTIYEYIKGRGAAEDAAAAADEDEDGAVIPTSAWTTLMQGAAAKMTASCITYPHEVVRTRLRELNHSRFVLCLCLCLCLYLYLCLCLCLCSCLCLCLSHVRRTIYRRPLRWPLQVHGVDQHVQSCRASGGVCWAVRRHVRAPYAHGAKRRHSVLVCRSVEWHMSSRDCGCTKTKFSLFFFARVYRSE